MHAGCRCHVDQGIEAEQIDFSAHQVRDPRLRDAEQFGRLGLT